MPFGSKSVKASSKTLMKLTPGFNFINIFCTKFLAPKFQTQKPALYSVWHQNFVQKCVRETLMKLTASRPCCELFQNKTQGVRRQA
jgi:hypothetical protein